MPRRDRAQPHSRALHRDEVEKIEVTEGRARPKSRLSAVVFPASFGPSSAKTSPGRSVSDTPLRAGAAP